MKRFNVQGMRLYYSSLEEAIKNNPDTEITECNDTDYLTDITKIKECFQFAGFLSHDEHSVRELYKGKNSHETIEILLFRDPTDNVYYDYLRYRRQVVGDLIVKTLWDVSNPHDFCRHFGITGRAYRQENTLWAQPFRLKQRHGRMHAEFSCLVRAGGDHAPGRTPSHNDGQSFQLGIVQYFYRCIKRVHVYMHDPALMN